MEYLLPGWFCSRFSPFVATRVGVGMEVSCSPSVGFLVWSIDGPFQIFELSSSKPRCNFPSHASSTSLSNLLASLIRIQTKYQRLMCLFR